MPQPNHHPAPRPVIHGILRLIAFSPCALIILWVFFTLVEMALL